jgi:hypothetical protein
LHVLSTPPAFVLSQDQTLRECFPVIGTTPRERNPPRNNRKVHSVLAVRLPGSTRQDFFKGTSSQPIGRRRGINISGVDFWHAVEFSRNGRFLCTHPRDSLRLSSGRFPSVLRFRLYQTLSCPISSALSRFPLSRFPFRRFRLYQILSGLIPSQRGLSSRLLGRSDE